MALTKGDLEAIEHIVRLVIGEELEGMAGALKVSLAVLDSRLSDLERKLDAGIAGIESNIESLRDVLSD